MASTESLAFTLSFLLPVGPLGSQEMAKCNTNNGCSVCGEPAKHKCSRCGAVRYCDAACQKENWKSHRWKNAKWQGLTFVSADRPVPNAFSLRINRYDNIQHNDVQKRMELLKVKEGPPPNTHGTTPFIVKVQVNSATAQGPAHTLFHQSPSDDGSSILIYDQRRTFAVALLRPCSEAASFDAVAEVVKTRGDRRIKSFFWAIRTGE
ncbi:hypothetical protein B0H19DRAFT_1070727 [Mycena capillaripes]|nr:hypothetical protein B0H19DRAFT_1070727 [Mycena capillaripes]